jgi:hypothetical protein
MKYNVLAMFFLFFSLLQAQNEDEKAVQKTIEDFFIGFHNQDATQIKNTVISDVILQTVSSDSTGNTLVKNEKFETFLKSITSIPKTTLFKEKIISYHIQIDGNMANAWTTYEFWLNNSFSHCGVNSFQLIKFEKKWKIIYVIDTRRKNDCNQDD